MAVRPEFVKELIELIDGDAWRMADRLVEEFPASEWGEGGSSAKTGLHAELEAYEDVLRREHGIVLTGKYMGAVRGTALAWPRADRSARVPFTAYYLVRGTDRRRQMADYQRRAAREGTALTSTMVGRFRSDDRGPKPLAPLDERLRRALSSTLKGLLIGHNIIIKRDDWWASKSVPVQSRRIAADVLRQLAEDIAP